MQDYQTILQMIQERLRPEGGLDYEGCVGEVGCLVEQGKQVAGLRECL
jgi:hypothetical protein